MISTLLSFDSRALRRASLALAGVATLAACDNDKALAPNPAQAPDAPSAAILPKIKTGALLISIVDQNNALPTTAGSQFTVQRQGGTAFVATDNAGNDKFAAIGGILLHVLPGKYTVCQLAAPAEYVLPTPAICFPIEVIEGTSTIGDASHVMFTIITAPRVSWVAYDNINGDSIPGFTFTGNSGSGPVVIADNSPLDLDPRGGVFEVKVLTGSSFTVCPNTAPAGYSFPALPQGCVTKAVTAGQTTSIGNMYVRHAYSAYWYVRIDGQISKGSEFKITHATTNTTVHVVDNGANDMQLGGMLYVKLAAAGAYSVCMTKAPEGGALASPTCRRIQVSLGEPGFAGDFDSKAIAW